MEWRVQSEIVARWETRRLRSAENELGRECVRKEFVDCGCCHGRIARADHGKKIEHECGVVARWEVDRISFRPAGANQGNTGGQEAALCDSGGRRRSAAAHQG